MSDSSELVPSHPHESRALSRRTAENRPITAPKPIQHTLQPARIHRIAPISIELEALTVKARAALEVALGAVARDTVSADEKTRRQAVDSLNKCISSLKTLRDIEARAIEETDVRGLDDAALRAIAGE